MQHYHHCIQNDKILDYLNQPKFSAWSYESEIRVVKLGAAMNANNQNKAFKFKDEALTEIIFRTSTQINIIDEYIDLCRNNGKSHVKLYQMTLGNGAHYELVKKELFNL